VDIRGQLRRRRGTEVPRLFGSRQRGSVSPRRRHRPVGPF